jgi:hypothetical protein
MLDFKNISDEKLNKWINVYESIPMVRIIVDVMQYKEAIVESYSRFKSDELERYFYFVYINQNGTIEGFKKWKLNNINEVDLNEL